MKKLFVLFLLSTGALQAQTQTVQPVDTELVQKDASTFYVMHKFALDYSFPIPDTLRLGGALYHSQDTGVLTTSRTYSVAADSISAVGFIYPYSNRYSKHLIGQALSAIRKPGTSFGYAHENTLINRLVFWNVRRHVWYCSFDPKKHVLVFSNRVLGDTLLSWRRPAFLSGILFTFSSMVGYVARKKKGSEKIGYFMACAFACATYSFLLQLGDWELDAPWLDLAAFPVLGTLIAAVSYSFFRKRFKRSKEYLNRPIVVA